ncbi:small HSP21-like protein [Aphelenchoides avenae]|nr:small HSP21-like protein [Aphelenchus avenae]KAH7705580.1 small HSP21-like protein [Aphelenchus avenae]
MNHWPPHWHHSHPWVSPFTRGNLSEFFDDSCRKHVHDQRGLGKLELTESGDFKWKCNISGYLPEELKVELEGNQIVVVGTHEEAREGESVYRMLKRRVVLPEGIDKTTIKSHIDKDGMLEIHASRPKTEEEKEKERIEIPITYWAMPYL